MRLSDAIKLGSMLKPQAFEGESHITATCALWAAGDAVGIGAADPKYPSQFDYGRLAEMFPMLHQELTCPAGCHDYGPRRIEAVIWHLNDWHRWSREQIADWVATVEPQETPAPATAEPALRFLAVDPVDEVVAMVHAR